MLFLCSILKKGRREKFLLNSTRGYDNRLFVLSPMEIPLVRACPYSVSACVGMVMILLCGTLFAEEGGQGVRLFSKGRYLITPTLVYLEDKTNDLTIDQVASAEYVGHFQKNNYPIMNAGISTSTYWLKFTIEYPDAYPNIEPLKRWYLEVGSSLLNTAELFVAEHDGIYQVKTSDLRTNYRDKEVVHAHSIFPVDMVLGERVDFYMRIKNSTLLRFSLILWTPEEFVHNSAIEEFLFGALFGSMLILLVYNLFLYFSVREISYLYYVLYLGGIVSFEFIEIGRGIIQFTDVFGDFDKEIILYFVLGSAISGALFAKSFMELPIYHPRINFLVNMYIAVAVLSSILICFFDYYISAFWNLVYMSMFLPLFLLMLLYCWMTGNENAKYFFWAWLSNVAGLMIFSGVTYQFIPATAFTVNVMPIGILIEAVTLSFALAHRIKNEQHSMLEADSKAMDNLQKYQSVFNNALEGMYKMNLDGRVSSANPAMCKLFGFSRVSDIVGDDRVHRLVFDDAYDQFIEMIECGVTTNQFSFVNKDGKRKWMSHSARVIYSIDGRASHIEGVVVNITQIKLKELAIKEKEREKVEREIAEASTSAKSEFLANMSHEIRTPLNAVIGFSESLKDKDLSRKEKAEAIRHVSSSSNDLLSLINDILDLSKIEAGMLLIERVEINVVEFVDRVVASFFNEAEKKGLKFDIVYRCPLPKTIMGDSLRIEQVLTNLCENGLKFTDEGSVMVVVSWNTDRDELYFEVVDSGVGMSEKVRRNLFRVFDQADTSSTRQYGGAGLGLAISKKLAVMMNGDIEVLSVEGKGSDFTFTVGQCLPSKVVWLNQKPTSKLSMPQPQQKQRVPSLVGTVLLAEDNVVNQKLIEKVLKRTGVNVVLAEDGLKACEKASAYDPDVILMDINMPLLDGIEATRRLVQQGGRAPIYALSAELDKADIEAARSAGCVGSLSKPLNNRELYGVLEEHLAAVEHKGAAPCPLKSPPSAKECNTDVMRQFAKDLPRIQELMIELVKSENWAKLRELASEVSEAAMSFQLEGLTKKSRKLEDALKEGDVDDVNHWLPKIVKEFGVVVESIEEKP